MEPKENQSEHGQDRGPAGEKPPRKPLSPYALRVLILQHPAEAKRPHGTATLVGQAHAATRIRKGFRWANLKKAWGSDSIDIQAGNWGVLFIGGRGEVASIASQETPGFYETSKGGGARLLSKNTRLQGVILLDGNWKEAKTLWWGNPWLLRLRRLVLVEEPASNIRLRRSSQKTALTTAECAAYCLKYLGNPQDSEPLFELFREQSEGVEAVESETEAPSTEEASIPVPRPSRELPPAHP